MKGNTMINVNKKSLIIGILLCLPMQVQAKKPKQASTLQELNQRIRSSGILNCFSIRNLEFVAQYTYVAALILFIIDHEKSGRPLMSRETLSKALLYAAGGLLTREILECFITHDSKNSVQYLASEQETEIEKTEPTPQVTNEPVSVAEPTQPVVAEQTAEIQTTETIITPEQEAQEEPTVEYTEQDQQPEEQVVVDMTESTNLTENNTEVSQTAEPQE